MSTFFYDVRELQMRLAKLGLYNGKIDGIAGPATDRAIVAFKRSKGLRARPFVGPKTWRALKSVTPDNLPKHQSRIQPPWLNELTKVHGLHEVRDNGALSAWLRSDGSTVGDPSKIAWCGDAMETAIRLALPEEPMQPLKGNPYWARNWQHFGVPCGLVLGAMVPMTRGKGGHIATLVGVSRDRTKIRCRGGNQSNMINDRWFDARRIYEGGRIIDYRWPSTCPVDQQRAAPFMDDAGAILSTNEA